MPFMLATAREPSHPGLLTLIALLSIHSSINMGAALCLGLHGPPYDLYNYH